MRHPIEAARKSPSAAELRTVELRTTDLRTGPAVRPSGSLQVQRSRLQMSRHGATGERTLLGNDVSCAHEVYMASDSMNDEQGRWERLATVVESLEQTLLVLDELGFPIVAVHVNEAIERAMAEQGLAKNSA